MHRTLFYLALPLLLLSCRKDPEVVPPKAAGGSWTFMNRSTAAAYSEVTAFKGYQLRFSDIAGTNTVSFLFRKKPEAALTYTAAADTGRAQDVAVRLEAAGKSFHAISAGNLNVDVELSTGKIFLRATGIRMVPDTNDNAESTLDFELREF